MILASVSPDFEEEELLPALVSYERLLQAELKEASAEYQAFNAKAWRGWAVAIGSAAMRATRRSGKELGLEAQLDVVRHFLSYKRLQVGADYT